MLNLYFKVDSFRYEFKIGEIIIWFDDRDHKTRVSVKGIRADQSAISLDGTPIFDLINEIMIDQENKKIEESIKYLNDL